MKTGPVKRSFFARLRSFIPEPQLMGTLFLLFAAGVAYVNVRFRLRPLGLQDGLGDVALAAFLAYAVTKWILKSS